MRTDNPALWSDGSFSLPVEIIPDCGIEPIQYAQQLHGQHGQAQGGEQKSDRQQDNAVCAGGREHGEQGHGNNQGHGSAQQQHGMGNGESAYAGQQGKQ